MKMANYLKRALEPVIKKAAKQFPAVVLTGPRQSGKTTLLKYLFGKTHKYLSLETPDVRQSAITDPRGFLENYAPPVIFDEIQYAPELLFYIKEKIDEKRGKNGQFILTGSQNILLSENVNETLAGRTAILTLLPLSYAEMIGKPSKAFPWEKKQEAKGLPLSTFWRLIQRGCFPELTEHPKKDPFMWYSSYIHTYLERDVRSLRQIGDLTQFQMFLKATALRSGSLFQISDVARDIGVAVNTIKSWISLLEATYQIVIVRPYFANIGKRLVKTPKIYFTDAGMLAYLCGLRDIELIREGPLAGVLFETYVFSELYKRFLNRGYDPQITFFRTSSGIEVDFLVEDQGKLYPIEVKTTSTPNNFMAEGIIKLKKDLSKVSKGYLIHLGDQIFPLHKDITAYPFAQF